MTPSRCGTDRETYRRNGLKESTMPKQKNLTPKPIKVPEENSKTLPVTAQDEAEAKSASPSFTYRRS